MDRPLIITSSQRLVILWAVTAGVLFAAIGHTLNDSSSRSARHSAALAVAFQDAKYLVALILIYAALWRARSRYEISDGAIACTTGVFFRKRRRISMAQIQDHGMERNLLGAFVGLTDVEIDCSGKIMPDLVLRQLSNSDARAVHERINTYRRQTALRSQSNLHSQPKRQSAKGTRLTAVRTVPTIVAGGRFGDLTSAI